ncbi:MAG: BTAD domain-containing putative transcriptional regulator [Candidatus Nezhaarchaeales archaeon]
MMLSSSDKLQERNLALRLSKLLSNFIPGYNPYDYEGRVIVEVAAEDAKSYFKALKYERGLRVWSGDAIAEWLELWVYKWRERVKLVFDKRFTAIFDKQRELVRETEGLWRALPYREELKELVILALIEVGEFCFTDLVAENIIRSELHAYKKRFKSEEAVLLHLSISPLKFAKNLMRRAKDLKHWRGPLVMFKVDSKILQGATGRIVNRIREANHYALFEF